MLFTFFLIIVGLITLVLFAAMFIKKDYSIHREIIINAPKQKVYDYLKQLKHQDDFNKWVMVNPGMKRTFTGEDGTVGFIYGWNGNKKAGEGEQEIVGLTEGEMIATEVRFVRPFPGIAYATTGTTAVSDTETKVTWSNSSKMTYPMNIMISMIEKMLGKDMETSLSNLKTILEK